MKNKIISLLAFTAVVFALGISLYTNSDFVADSRNSLANIFSSGGDNSPVSFGPDRDRTSEVNLQNVLDNLYSGVNKIDDQIRAQEWSCQSDANMTVKFIGHWATRSLVFGYYTDSNLGTFVPLFRRGDVKLSDNYLPKANAGNEFTATVSGQKKIGFAIKSWFNSSYTIMTTHDSLNSNSKARTVSYNPNGNTFLIGFEDLYNDYDNDFNDLVVEVKIDCADTNNNPPPPAPVDDSNEEEQDEQDYNLSNINLDANIRLSTKSIELGKSSRITWSSNDANSCIGSNFNTGNKTSGSLTVTPSSVGTYQYTVTCNNNEIGESVSDSVTLTVKDVPVLEPEPEPEPEPIVTPTANLQIVPSVIDRGQSIKITWSSTNADKCYSSGTTAFNTNNQTSGQLDVVMAEAGIFGYSVTCQNTNSNTFSTNSAAVLVNDVETVSQDGIYNVKNYGAVGNGVADDTLALRSAYDAAANAGGGTIYLPEGTYKVAPTDGWVIKIHSSNIHFLGDGPDKTIISAYASGMRHPNDKITGRGGMFTTHRANKPLTNISFKNLRVTGNANVTDLAGAWPGKDEEGWDTSHKALGIWGTVDNVLIENTEWDHWRGEIIYAGGGASLGRFTIRDTKVHDSNASAISMTGNVLLENVEIYDVYNALENFSIADHHGTIVRNSIIDVNRNFPGKDGVTKKIGKFGVVYLGNKAPNLLVENSEFGNTRYGAIFLSEFAHGVTVRNNIFKDTTALYAINLRMSTYDNFRKDNAGYSDILFEDNTLIAENSNSDAALVFYTERIKNLMVKGNVLKHEGAKYSRFARIPNGATGTFLFENNTSAAAFFSSASHTNGTYLKDSAMRPTWINNTTASREALYTYTVSNEPKSTTPIWTHVSITDAPADTKFQVTPDAIGLYPEGFELTFTRNFKRRVAIVANPQWNDLSEDVWLQTSGDSISFKKGPSVFNVTNINIQ